jgi:very-short-patch-repair endonuclease
MSDRTTSDEHYVLDLCDEVIGAQGLRQHRFEWLVGDVSPTTGRAVRLPVDSYWPEQRLVVEVRESQHFEPTPFFDKPDRLTVSGVHRGDQRRRYDALRDSHIPAHGLRLVVIRSDDFATRGKKILRSRSDIDVVRRLVDAVDVAAAKAARPSR